MSPAPDERQTALFHDLQQALPDDLWIRYDVDPGHLQRVAVRGGIAGATVSHHAWRGARWVSGYAADPGDAAHVRTAVDLVVGLAASAAADGEAVTGVTVPRGGLPLLPADLRPAEHDEWDAWCTLTPPPRQLTPYGGDARVIDLAAGDPRIAALLEASSPTASIAAGDPRVVRWAGIEDPEGGLPGTGGLAAVLAVTRQRSGSHHLNSVATHPERRGRRLARLLCAEVTRDALAAGAPAVSLGMYAENDAARRVYAGLGFRWLRGSTSGALASSGADHH
ncbi:MAG: GNAT family N-acetyltransferase [Candidatus Nanopelagicales bacterium]